MHGHQETAAHLARIAERWNGHLDSIGHVVTRQGIPCRLNANDVSCMLADIAITSHPAPKPAARPVPTLTTWKDGVGEYIPVTMRPNETFVEAADRTLNERTKREVPSPPVGFTYGDGKVYRTVFPKDPWTAQHLDGRKSLPPQIRWGFHLGQRVVVNNKNTAGFAGRHGNVVKFNDTTVSVKHDDEIELRHWQPHFLTPA